MFFIITCNFAKAASKPASVFHPVLPGTCDEASLSFPLSTRLHLTTTYKRTTNYGVLMKAGKKLWNTFHLVLIIHQDFTQCSYTRYRPKNVHFHFRNYWATIYQNSQRVLCLYLNQCQVVSCQPEPTTKSDVRSIILQLVHSIHFNESTYPYCRIESCAVLSYFVSPSLLTKWKRFY